MYIMDRNLSLNLVIEKKRKTRPACFYLVLLNSLDKLEIRPKHTIDLQGMYWVGIHLNIESKH